MRVFVTTLLASTVLLMSVPAEAQWFLWESPYDDEANLGASQQQVDRYHGSQNGNGVGQSFKPTGNHIYRIDLKLKNRTDRRPFTLKLWKWNDTAGTTIGCTEDVEYVPTVGTSQDPIAPIWLETVIVPGPDANEQIRSFFPGGSAGLEVDQGEPYYLELGHGQPDAEWAVHAYWDDDPDDPYEDGMLRVNDRFRWDESCIAGATPPANHGDLYFKIYTATGTQLEALTCADGAPAPCFSAAGSWTDPLPSGGAITKLDYKAFVEERAQCNLSIAGKNAARETFFDAFLFEVGTDTANAQCVVDLFRKAYDWRSANLNDDIGFTWMERPGWAYRWIDGFPAAADDAMIKSLLLHSGYRFWDEHEPGDSRRELGGNNRALGGALTYKLITSVIPAGEFDDIKNCVVPLPQGENCLFAGLPAAELDKIDHAAWSAHADQVWGDFKTYWDFPEDSGHYHTLSWRFVLELDKLYVADNGDPSVWTDASFRDLVERFFNLHTPLGPFPVHGDVNGWNQDFGSPALLFETAAAQYAALKLPDPGYRWMAFRLMDYHRTHAFNSDPGPDAGYPALWQIVYNEYPAFAFAYFAVNESLATLQPDPQAELQDASQDQNEDGLWRVRSGGLGQTFKPIASPLIGLDFKVTNRGDTSPGTIQLWKWNPAGYAATVAQTPLYEDAVDLSGPDVDQLRSFFPFLDVVEGDSYFVEFNRATPFEVRGSRLPFTDYYPDGSIYNQGVQSSKRDLWFRTYTLSRNGSIVTTRLEAESVRVSQQGDPRQNEVFGTEQVPDKLILRSGYDPDDMHAVINLIVSLYGHGQLETGEIVSLINDGSRLLSSSGYFDKQDKDQSRGIVRRYWGGTDRLPTDRTAVDLDEYRLTSVASILWDDQRGWDNDLERRVFFVKNRFMLVRDGFSFGSDVEASVGNIWHGYDVRPEHGTNWYELYDQVPEGLNGFEYKNPEQYVLTHLVNPGYQSDEWEVDYSAGNPPSAQFIVGQRWQGTAPGGSVKWFDTVLLPHGPEITPAQAFSNVTVRYDDGVNIAVSVVVDDETWTVVDNPEGLSINTGDLETDATYLVTRTAAGEPYVLAHQATRVYVDDGFGAIIDMTWPVSTTVEIDGIAAACASVSPCIGGGSCVPGWVLSDSDTEMNSCSTPEGGLILCGPGKTVHHKTRACNPASCCFTQPACLCPVRCGTSTELVCEP